MSSETGVENKTIPIGTLAGNSTSSVSRKLLRRYVYRLAWPVFIEMLLQMAVGVVDIAMVGRIGPSAIAAVGFANSLLMFVIAVFAAISVGTTALVARHIGAGELERAHEIARQSLILSLLLSFGITLLGVIFPVQGIRLMMAMQAVPDQEVLDQGALFVRIVSLTMIPGLVMQIVNGVLRGAGDTKTPMRVNVIVNIVNIAGCLILVGGIQPFTLSEMYFTGISSLGVLGAAVSTALARALGGILSVWVLFRGNFIIHLSLRDSYRFNFPEMKRILNIGIPAAIEQVIMRGGQLLYGVIVGGLGTVAYAAHNVTMTAESLSFLPGFAFAVAATTMVGQALGAEDPKLAEESGKIATKVAIGLMSVMGVVFFFFAPALVSLFSSDPEVISLGAECLKIVAISQPPLALVMVLSGALRGAGDTKTVLYITGAGIWLVRVIFAYVFTTVFNWGLVGAWYAMIIDLFVRSILYYWRFRQGKWKNIRV
ncbi:MAG: MATE family efflux transporter [Desulfitobacterium hafniense]|nr:MATE family efflux transporter [Desulfitobacterium hafniense]